jgi:Leucine-rich repeat (LRR) protein
MIQIMKIHLTAMKKLFLIPILIGAVLSVSFGQVPESDSLALVALYNSTNGDGWTDKGDWLQPGQPVSTWNGIRVRNNRVEEIHLDKNNLVGTLPEEIGNLTTLKILELKLNQISGTIPATLWELTGLTWLSLWGNQLVGTIPIEIGNLIHLEVLYLFENELEGSIPAEIGNLVQLEELFLARNQLTGCIPSELGHLHNLQVLIFSGNQLTDSIPPELGNLMNLQMLWLDNNKLTGSIPAEIGNMSVLTSVNLSFNELEGHIPAQFGNMTSLEQLKLRNNRLTGNIPPEMGNLTHLENLSLPCNELIGSIPPELGNLTALTHFGLYDNQLSGTIPPELGNLAHLVELNLKYNQLKGPVPDELGKLDSLTKLILGFNELTGSIPDELGRLSKLQALELNDNHLEGPVSGGIVDLPALIRLTLQNNYFSFCDLEPLTGLDINYFQYGSQGSIPLATELVYGVSGKNLEIDITGLTRTECTASNNQYRWWKEGLYLSDYSDSPVLSMTGLDISDEGHYYCTMINSDFPDLLLTTDTVTLVIDGPIDIVLTPDSVDEHVTPGALVGILAVDDPDQDSGHSFTFTAGDGSIDVDNDSFMIRDDSLFILISPDFEIREEYTVVVRATDEDSKSYEKVLTIRINDVREPGPTGLNIQEVMSFRAKVYPNPASEYVILEYESPEAGELSVALYDLLGHLLQSFLFQTPPEAGRQHLRLILDSNMPAGHYLLMMQDGSGIKSIPFIKYEP